MSAFFDWLPKDRVPETIQAIAAVIALVLAIFVPIRIRNLDRRSAEDERNRKASALAFFIFEDVYNISLEAISALSILKVSPKSYPKEKVVDALNFIAARRLQAIVERLWLLQPDCGEAAYRAITLGLSCDRGVHEFFKEHDTSTKSLETFSTIYKLSIMDAKRNADHAVELLSKHYDLHV